MQLLRAPADADNKDAAYQLATVLYERGDLDGLRAQIDAGNGYAALWLEFLLARQGRGEEEEQLRRFGLDADGSIACA